VVLRDVSVSSIVKVTEKCRIKEAKNDTYSPFCAFRPTPRNAKEQNENFLDKNWKTGQIKLTGKVPQCCFVVTFWI
jgi:hypothetical protein